MKKLIDLYRQSFSMRLSLWVVLFTALIFLLSQGYASLLARRSVRQAVIAGADPILENTILKLNGILEEVEQSADNLEWLVYRHLDEPESILEYSRTTIQGAPFLAGCSISFEPYYYKGKKYFSAYSSNVDGVISTKQEGDDEYQYFYLDWYLQPKLLNQPCWTEPYCDWDYDDEEDLQTQMMVSYCKPLTDTEGKFIGVISLDLSLKWLSETIISDMYIENSFNIIVSRGGTYLVHPDPDRLFYHTVYTSHLAWNNPDMYRLGKSMQAWESGMQEMDFYGVQSTVFYKPIPSTGWSVALICPEKDMFADVNRLRNITFALMLAGLLLMFAVCFQVIRKSLEPLHSLARQAESIADGHFDTVLPEINNSDEIGTLTRSFSHMQSSLVNYIDELRETTAKKERIDQELQIARDIQMAMIPQTFPPFPEHKELDLYASMTPAKEVGGDLFDFFIQHDTLYFCVGDVSGKGVPASLVMAVVRNLFRLIGQQGRKPVGIAQQLNDMFADDNPQLLFVTMFIGAVDLKTGDLDYCNCGHNPPVIIPRKGRPHFLNCKPNVCLGVTSGFVFEGQQIKSFLDTPMLLYTDGLNEAENIQHEQLGNDRLLEVLASHKYKNATDTVKLLQQTVRDHVGAAEPSDDLTLMCLEIKREKR